MVSLKTILFSVCLRGWGFTLQTLHSQSLWPLRLEAPRAQNLRRSSLSVMHCALFLWFFMSFLSWPNLNRKILTSPFKLSSSQDLADRSHRLGFKVGLCLRVGDRMDGRTLAKVGLPQGVRSGAGFLVTQVLLSSPSEARTWDGGIPTR